MKSMKVLGMALLGMSIIMASCTGDQGEPGPKGDSIKGDSGTPGKDGIACWDIDGDGMAEVDTEDFNNDGEVNALDCQGMDGQDGSDKPNMDFYFQNDFNSYIGTQDAQISPTASANLNNEFMAVVEDLDDAAQERRIVIRFDDIGNEINAAFGTDDTGCGSAYDINQAILYLYCTGTNADNDVSGKLNLGFYQSEDPTFNENDATWTIAGEATGLWADLGGESVEFVGPLGDSYTYQLPHIPSGLNSFGWIAIPLPRSVVSNWSCDDTGLQNKGMRIRLQTQAAAGSTRLTFASSENPALDLRPLLVIQTTEKDPAAGKMAPSSKAKDWDNMSYEEKMAPLFRYFAAKEAN